MKRPRKRNDPTSHIRNNNWKSSVFGSLLAFNPVINKNLKEIHLGFVVGRID